MTRKTGNETTVDYDLDNVFAAYLDAVDEGEKPDQEELLARHPKWSAELQAFFDHQNRVSTLLRPIRPRPPVAGPELQSFGDYEVLGEITRGGMGVVYKVRQKSAERDVALKMILPGRVGSAADLQRFRREAVEVANFDHPHIVPIYDVGENAGRPYFSMRLMEGGSLATRMADFRLPLLDRKTGKDAKGKAWTSAQLRQRRDAIVNLIRTVAGAVHHAHQRGILHRDLKPGNILLDNLGNPYVTDFGLAKRIEGNGKLTQSGAIVGTPNYMAPEQTVGPNGLSTAVDGYALGVILYELLTGEVPFQGATVLDTLLKVRSEEPRHPRLVNPRIAADLETICLKCLQKDPKKRFSGVAELAEDLRRYQAGEPIKARQVGTVERAVKWCRRNPVAATGRALLATAAVALVVSAWSNSVEKARSDVAESNKLASDRRHIQVVRETEIQNQRVMHFQRNLDTANRKSLDFLDQAGELDRGPQRVSYQLQRALTLVRVRDHAQAARVANSLVAEKGLADKQLYTLACVYALCSGDVTETDDRFAEPFGDRAVAQLRLAAAAGFFRDPDNLVRLRTDTDLASLQNHPGFRDLLRDLERPANGGIEAAPN